MNVGYVCKTIPAYLPHELLGYPSDSLPGMLLTFDIVDKIITKENEQTSQASKGSKSRINKFKANK